MNQKAVKIIAAFAAVIVVANFLLLIFGRIDALLFWLIMIVAAVFAWKVLPKMRK